MRCDRTPAWRALQSLYASSGANLDLRRQFDQDPGRFEAFSQDAPHVFADLSKNLIDLEIERQLFVFARQCGVEEHRDAMFRGDSINTSEKRAVKHVLLRTPLPAGGVTDDPDLRAVHETLDAMLAYAEVIRADSAITDVVNIGIGGSDLGPQMAVLALDAFATRAKRLHFVSNIDGHEMAATLRTLRPASTLFLIASKTFTTIETMTNAQSAKRWFEAGGGTDIARHFCALTSNVAGANAFGITTTFGFRDWVGGRYSLWSVIGLPIAMAIGAQGFREFLAGAHAMDGHFRGTPLESNLPARLGLLDVWYRNFLGFTSRSIAPYHSAMRRWPAYLQQLEMESNGKRVDTQGETVPFGTAPVLWGEPGTSGQHAYFQMLHQGTDVVPVEFVAVRKPQGALPGHHELLLANVLAQAQALMVGKADTGGQKDFPGNRPSIFLLLEELTPTTLGALIALQEHRVFVSGSVWGINSFDQWGVELGKVLAKDLDAQRRRLWAGRLHHRSAAPLAHGALSWGGRVLELILTQARWSPHKAAAPIRRVLRAPRKEI
jgi:glucose-6-phosphate isomerase